MQLFRLIGRLGCMKVLLFLTTASLLLFTIPILARPVDTAAAEKKFTAAQLEADVDYLITTIGRVHPNPYHNISEQAYLKLTDSVRDQLHNGMTANEAWPLLARLVGALNEGHSVFDFPDGIATRLKNGDKVIFPLLISKFNGNHLVVRLDLSDENKLTTGDEITAINGIEIPNLVDKLSGYAGGMQTFRALDVCRNMSVCLYLYGIHGPYQVNFLHQGRLQTTVLNPISWPELLANNKDRSKAAPGRPKQTSYGFIYPNENYALLTVNSLTEKPEVFRHFLDSCFKCLQSKPAPKLIIDFRANGGGNSVLGEMLLGYITQKPFRMSGGEKWKVSAEYKTQIRKKNGADTAQMAYYLNAKNGSIISDNGAKPTVPPPNPLVYKGRVFFLIGPNTFSSANMTVNAIGDFHLATLVGEPTGEPANDYGELIFLKLPNTGFGFSTSTKQFIRANGNSKDTNPVFPDHRIGDDPSTPQDEVLELAKRL